MVCAGGSTVLEFASNIAERRFDDPAAGASAEFASNFAERRLAEERRRGGGSAAAGAGAASNMADRRLTDMAAATTMKRVA